MVYKAYERNFIFQRIEDQLDAIPKRMGENHFKSDEDNTLSQVLVFQTATPVTACVFGARVANLRPLKLSRAHPPLTHRSLEHLSKDTILPGHLVLPTMFTSIVGCEMAMGEFLENQ